MAWTQCDYGNFQGAGDGTGSVADTELGWGQAGGFDRTRRRGQSGVLLSAGALRVLEKRIAGTRIADGDVWGKFHHQWLE